ncbi:unnamed protein product [Ambrosiozyma monospora]|uniref:Unnamed protein product n=1 Tax=Ambrosiozyma monospora TaxID=43982 RepID=A0ACB5UCC5_AMBMO|nr:unnamed protein product [Ambrosiozyma monospora]
MGRGRGRKNKRNVGRRKRNTGLRRRRNGKGKGKSVYVVGRALGAADVNGDGGSAGEMIDDSVSVEDNTVEPNVDSELHDNEITNHNTNLSYKRPKTTRHALSVRKKPRKHKKHTHYKKRGALSRTCIRYRLKLIKLKLNLKDWCEYVVFKRMKSSSSVSNLALVLFYFGWFR